MQLPVTAQCLCELHQMLDAAVDPSNTRVILADNVEKQTAKQVKLQVKLILSRRANDGCSHALRYASERGWPGFEIRVVAE